MLHPLRFLLLALAAILPEDLRAAPAQALEEQIQKVIEGASPSVVAVVASHHKYPGPPSKLPGKLGGYTPAPPERVEIDPAVKIPAVDRLDLRLVDNVADNQFGSGLVLDAEKGLILTAYHLIEGATKVFVRTPGGQGSYADIHAADAKSDLAVLKLIQKLKGLADAKLGTVQTPKIGSMLVAVGHPLASGFADGKPSGSWGILSNLRRRPAPPPGRDELRSNKPLYHYGSLIQTDARIALGSSGAALLNLDGEVIGISSSVAAVTGSEASGGYAIPFDRNYRRIIAVLQAGQEVEYGFLGVTLAQQFDGATTMIGGVTPGCPAALAGLRTGDVILAVDGQPLDNHDDLLLYVGAALAGTEVTVTVGRNGQKFKKSMVLAKIANALPSVVTVPGPGFGGLRIDHSSMLLFRNGAQGAGAFEDPPVGVSVRDIEAGSPAEKKVKEAGADIAAWILTKVGDTAVATPAEFAKAVEGRKSVQLKFVDPANPNKSILLTLP